MSKKVSITLDDEILKFIDDLASDSSSFINEVLWKEKKRIFRQKLEDAYTEQANNPDFQQEISVWDVSVGDGLNN